MVASCQTWAYLAIVFKYNIMAVSVGWQKGTGAMRCMRRMDHFTVVTDRLAESRAFYERLGLQVGPRPDFPIAGLWLYAEGHAVLHIVEVGSLPSPTRGVLDHMAFYGDDIVATLELLQRERIAYTLIRAPRPWGTWQVFFEDPSGAEVEIDFDATQKVPAHLKDGSVPSKAD
jgi:catechol 2,3-dioxygenase-like lactoylglutathione lyase family enzyme